MKSIIEGQKASGQLVRLAGQLESGRRMNEYHAKIEKFIDDRFVYKVVDLLPPQAAEWRAYAQRVLELTRGARDLDYTSENFILNVDNGDWQDEDVICHFCIPDCPLECRSRGVGRERHALENVKKAAVLCIGGPLEKCLAYRWKGFEKASSWALRGRRYHDLLKAAFLLLCPKSVVTKARAALARRLAIQPGAVDEATRKMKHNVRGGSVIEWFEGGSY